MSTQFAALPHPTRNQVFTALFNLLQTLPTPTGQKWAMFSQWVRQWDDVPSNEQPCILMHRGPQTADQKTFGVTRWKWRVLVWIYYRVDGLMNQSNYPDQLTDPFLDAVEQLFQTDPLDGRQTLGGLVWHVWIDGTITWDPGFLDGQGVIVIPLSIYL